MPSISPRDVFSMLGADFSQFIFLPSVGASGGILVTWTRFLFSEIKIYRPKSLDISDISFLSVGADKKISIFFVQILFKFI